MGDKYYKPVLKDGDHLVRSQKNPDRVRGQSRDANNKNPDIIEWEEVDADEIAPRKSREEMEFELEQMAYEERRAEQDREITTLENINSGLELINNVLVFLNENPEVAAALVSGGKKITHAISSGVKSAVRGVKSIFTIPKKTKAEMILEEKQQKEVSSELVISKSTSIADSEVLHQDESQREDMSIDEARNLVIEILANYINMKRNLERLSKARINDFDMPQLDMNQVLAYMDSIVERYPALMDKQTYSSVMDILNANSNIAENHKILAALRIDTNDGAEGYLQEESTDN